MLKEVRNLLEKYGIRNESLVAKFSDYKYGLEHLMALEVILKNNQNPEDALNFNFKL